MKTRDIFETMTDLGLISPESVFAVETHQSPSGQQIGVMREVEGLSGTALDMAITATDEILFGDPDDEEGEEDEDDEDLDDDEMYDDIDEDDEIDDEGDDEDLEEDESGAHFID